MTDADRLYMHNGGVVYFHSAHVYPFILKRDTLDMYFGSESFTHAQLARNNPDYDTHGYDSPHEDDNALLGRVFLDQQTIALWDEPSGKGELVTIMNAIRDHFQLDSVRYWRIKTSDYNEVQPYITDYIGDDSIVMDEINRDRLEEHMKSPLLKRPTVVPDGIGSKRIPHSAELIETGTLPIWNMYDVDYLHYVPARTMAEFHHKTVIGG